MAGLGSGGGAGDWKVARTGGQECLPYEVAVRYFGRVVVSAASMQSERVFRNRRGAKSAERTGRKRTLELVMAQRQVFRPVELVCLCNAIMQLSARTAEIWTAVAERSGDTAFRAWPCFRKRRGASLPAAVQTL
jgi:hypothetical protein